MLHGVLHTLFSLCERVLAAVYLKDRIVCIASKPAPTFKIQLVYQLSSALYFSRRWLRIHTADRFRVAITSTSSSAVA